MKQIFGVILFVFIGIVLLWFGFTLFFRFAMPGFGKTTQKRQGPQPKSVGNPGDPQICPVCSAKLREGETVSTSAFPSLNGGNDRFMHIKGCLYCLHGNRDRVCPVCGDRLTTSEILISRLFERPGRRSHVHVIGCTNCKGPRTK